MAKYANFSNAGASEKVYGSSDGREDSGVGLVETSNIVVIHDEISLKHQHFTEYSITYEMITEMPIQCIWSQEFSASFSYIELLMNCKISK